MWEMILKWRNTFNLKPPILYAYILANVHRNSYTEGSSMEKQRQIII
jgi:hypothetical protein